MPTYNFECKNKKCGKTYEDFAFRFDESGKYPDIVCPHCRSKRKKQLMSAANFAFTNPVGTDRWNNTSTGHDYRFKHNIPKVKAEREMAEQFSHMGASPYGAIDDTHLDVGVHDAETRKGLS